MKQIGSDDLVRALQTVARGESLLDPAVTQRVFERMRAQARHDEGRHFAMLTDQELVILGLITHGMTNKEIARRIYLGEKTVRNYVSSILGKLEVSSRAEAAVFAVRHHIENHLPSDFEERLDGDDEEK